MPVCRAVKLCGMDGRTRPVEVAGGPQVVSVYGGKAGNRARRGRKEMLADFCWRKSGGTGRDRERERNCKGILSVEAGILHEPAGERKIVLNHIVPGKDRRGRVFAAEPGWTGSWTRTQNSMAGSNGKTVHAIPKSLNSVSA